MCVLTAAAEEERSENAKTYLLNSRFIRDSFGIPHMHTDSLDRSFLLDDIQATSAATFSTQRGTMMGIKRPVRVCLAVCRAYPGTSMKDVPGASPVGSSQSYTASS